MEFYVVCFVSILLWFSYSAWRCWQIRNRFKFHLNIRLSAIFQAFCGPAFQLLSREKGMIEHPDTIDDLFRLCGR